MTAIEERWSIMTDEGLTMWREDLFTREEALAFVAENPTTPSGAQQIAAPESVIRAAAAEWRRILEEHERAIADERRAAVAGLISSLV